MQKTSSRLLALLSLLQTHRDWPGGDLARQDLRAHLLVGPVLLAEVRAAGGDVLIHGLVPFR